MVFQQGSQTQSLSLARQGVKGHPVYNWAFLGQGILQLRPPLLPLKAADKTSDLAQPDLIVYFSKRAMSSQFYVESTDF